MRGTIKAWYVGRCTDVSGTRLDEELMSPSCCQTNPEYNLGRCFAFVHDLSDVDANYPIPNGTLDVIVLIFVLSALHPTK